jgi:hypothetical protein
MRWREDTGQLFFVAGGTWREGFCGLGTELVVSGAFTKRNIGVVCTTRHGLGEAPAARGGVG